MIRTRPPIAIPEEPIVPELIVVVPLDACPNGQRDTKGGRFEDTLRADDMDTLTAEFEASLEDCMRQHVVVLGRSTRQPFECRIPDLGVVLPVDVGCAGRSANSIVSHELILERHPDQVKSSLGARPGWPEKPTGCMGCSPGIQITPAHGKGDLGTTRR